MNIYLDALRRLATPRSKVASFYIVATHSSYFTVRQCLDFAKRSAANADITGIRSRRAGKRSEDEVPGACTD